MLVFAVSAQAAEIPKWTSDQKRTIKESYHRGKPFGVGYTLAAINIHESKAGRFKINLNGPACGLYHNLLTSVMARQGVEDNIWNRNRACTMLMDDDYAASHAIKELMFWWSEYKGEKHRYAKMIRSYRSGYNPYSKEATEYLNTINEWVKYLQKHPELVGK